MLSDHRARRGPRHFPDPWLWRLAGALLILLALGFRLLLCAVLFALVALPAIWILRWLGWL